MLRYPPNSNLLNTADHLEDINECTTGTATCTPHSTCSNSDGNYTCPCENGFEGDGWTSCVGMNEQKVSADH